MGRLKIDMLGTSFTIQANEENEYLEKLLGYYRRITDDVKNIDSINSPLQVAILSGIMLCDELYKEKQNKVALENEKTTSDGSKNNSEQVLDEELKKVASDFEEIQKKTAEMIKKIDKVL